MRWLAGMAFALMHAACSGGAPAPDALTADASTGGLVIEVVAKGGVPQMPEPTIEITRVTIGVKNLRAIGDAAPGDLRTTRTDAEPNNIDLDFYDSFVPVPQLFRDAPPGVYSSVELRVADSRLASAAIDVLGRASRGGNLVPFEVKCALSEVPITIAVNTVLMPRMLATTTIEVDVAWLVKDIDWDAVPLTAEGRLFVGDGDPEMASVVSNVATAFSAAQ
ncbi:MAG: hypothetical protein M4D80_27450 [Myxococcota bacterium]|nr:hypothetical protein [Deltaproteobacteria bacterium]MDQ3338917.1 hypothetical protein [Myxococcota bacterium]